MASAEFKFEIVAKPKTLGESIAEAQKAVAWFDELIGRDPDTGAALDHRGALMGIDRFEDDDDGPESDDDYRERLAAAFMKPPSALARIGDLVSLDSGRTLARCELKPGEVVTLRVGEIIEWGDEWGPGVLNPGLPARADEGSFFDPLAARVNEMAAAMVATGGITLDQAMVFAKARVEREAKENSVTERQMIYPDPYKRMAHTSEERIAAYTMGNHRAQRKAAFTADVVPDKRTTERPHPWECDESEP